jgi:hypothetical protein
MTPPTGSTRNDEAYALILSAITEVKTIVTSLDSRVRALEQATVEQSVTAAQKLDALFRRVDEHSAQIREVENDLTCRVRDRQVVTDDLYKRFEVMAQRVQEVEGVAKLVKWLGAAVGGLVVALVWGILTHTIQIGMP